MGKALGKSSLAKAEEGGSPSLPAHTNDIKKTIMMRKLFNLLNRKSTDNNGGTPHVNFVDLGLPSGTLWADSDVENPVMSGCDLPTYEQAQELIEHCDFLKSFSSDGKQFMFAKGPNGHHVLFPMAEYEVTPGLSGCCWCKGESSNPQFGFFLLLSDMTITIGAGLKSLKFPYRMVRNK